VLDLTSLIPLLSYCLAVIVQSGSLQDPQHSDLYLSIQITLTLISMV